MPLLYLSPSTQEYNPYAGGGNEEYYMNLLADAMVPYLRSSGIRFTRNDPNQTAAWAIQQSNLGNYDLHLALHSNAAPEGQAGTRRGPEIYYYPGDPWGQAAAEFIGENLRDIYPQPWLVRVGPNTTLGELRLTRAPSAFIELAYHDNLEDANWIRQNIGQIAANIVLSLTQYFGIPFIPAQPARTGTVVLQSGNLNIRRFPSTQAAIIGRIPNGSAVTVLGEWEGWYVVDFNGTVGYSSAQYIRV